MTLSDSFLIAIEALKANRMRACLTMLGIIIGVGAVIALMAVGQGSQKAITDQIAGLGSNLLFVRPGASSSGGVSQGNGSAQTLTQADSDAIASQIPDVVVSAPQQNAGAQVMIGGTNTFTTVAGVTPDYLTATGLTINDGDFFTQDDIDHTSKVVVLGASVAKKLFPDGSSPVGQTMKLTSGRTTLSVTIDGVLATQGGNASSSNDDRILAPLSLVQKQISFARAGTQNSSIVNQITVKVDKKENLNTVKQQITDLLLTQHKVATADFTVESQDDLAAAANQVAQTMTLLLGAIAGISLIVGGIGIMNIMLVSVTERTREIGIRKAVGARQGDISMQFLTEALMLTVLGGAIGIATGVGIAHLLDGRSIAGLGDSVHAIVSWPSVGIAFGVSAALGLFFGIYPAQRAARMRPIDALHYE